MEQENRLVFYKQVADIEALHKKDISGNLIEYFEPLSTDQTVVNWIKPIDPVIKKQVEDAALNYLK